MDGPVPEITATEAATRQSREPDLILLDCREADELPLARIDGALHIPMGDVPVRLRELDPDKPIVVFCHHGRRSLSVAGWLLAHDYANVVSMKGGIEAWAREVDSSVGRY